MAHLRARARARAACSRAAELRDAPDGRCVRTAGHVIVRQRPGSAKGFCFLTLEDETGTSNADPHAATCSGASACRCTPRALVEIEGPLQNVDGVIHVRVERLARSIDPVRRAARAAPRLARLPLRRRSRQRGSRCPGPALCCAAVGGSP